MFVLSSWRRNLFPDPLSKSWFAWRAIVFVIRGGDLPVLSAFEGAMEAPSYQCRAPFSIANSRYPFHRGVGQNAIVWTEAVMKQSAAAQISFPEGVREVCFAVFRVHFVGCPLDIVATCPRKQDADTRTANILIGKHVITRWVGGVAVNPPARYSPIESQWWAPEIRWTARFLLDWGG